MTIDPMHYFELQQKGGLLAAKTRSQLSSNELLAPPHPDEVAVAAGIMAASLNQNVQFAYVLAYDLHNAGALVIPELLPKLEE